MRLEQLGPYRLGKQLGKGGMGTVYEGVEVDTDEPAAIKVLSPSLAGDEGFRVRFEAEIESLKKLRHTNIVRLMGYGEQAGTLFYAMELVRGTSLEDELRAGRRFDWREVTAIGIKLCRALKHAHDHGVVHRDLKPANVMLTADGEVKLSDFGIARLFGNTRLTADGGVLGTAEFMAPEQAAGQAVTDRCDQYSLGGVLYALLAGRPPFRATTLVEMLQLQRYAEPEPVTRFAPETPAELARIIHQLLDKDPHKRYANTLILARSLEAMERGLSVSLSRGDDFVLSSPDAPRVPISGYSPQSPTLSPTELGELEDSAGNEAQDVQVTAPTMAFDAAAKRSDSPDEGSAATDTSVDRFTKVGLERARLEPEADESHAGLLSPQTLLLAAALVLLVLAAWYMMQPPSADRLYREIEIAASDGDLDQLKAALPRIELFLEHYTDDSRAEQVQTWLEEAQQNHPVQRAYTEAKRLAVLSPESAEAKFQAIVDVYDDGDDAPETVRHFVKLSRIKLKDLRKQISQRLADDRQALESRLSRAGGLAADDPAAARKIYEGIITLYAEKPWAAQIVGHARAGLVEIDEKQAAARN